MGIEKLGLEPVIPDCKLELKIEAIRSHGEYGNIEVKLL